LQENIVIIAKYKAQIHRLELELQQLRAGRQPLGGQALATEDAPALAAETRRQQHQMQTEPLEDAAMADVMQQPAEQPQQRQESGKGLWM
jgi:hypothetical protein